MVDNSGKTAPGGRGYGINKQAIFPKIENISKLGFPGTQFRFVPFDVSTFGRNISYRFHSIEQSSEMAPIHFVT